MPQDMSRKGATGLRGGGKVASTGTDLNPGCTIGTGQVNVPRPRPELRIYEGGH